MDVLQHDIRVALRHHNISYDDVEYVCMNDNYHSGMHDFMHFTMMPKIWQNEPVYKDPFERWCLPDRFRIVLNDGGFVTYVKTCNQWMHFGPNVKPDGIFHEPRVPSPSPVSLLNLIQKCKK